MENTGSATRILEQFCGWLVSPDGEQKDRKTATQHVLQWKRVMSVTGGGPASLVDKKIRDIFLPQAKKIPCCHHKVLFNKPSTLFFVPLEDKPSCIDYDKDNVIDLRDKLKKWSASYKQQTTRRRWERQGEDVSSLIMPEKVKEFEQSQAT